jgi:thiamine biosynthesis lipoprotein
MTQALSLGYTQTRVFMDTTVTIDLSGGGWEEELLAERTERAFGWFAEVERRCSRFDETSELRSLSRRVAEPVPVSTLLLRTLELSVEVYRMTGGALDPTIGRAMEQAGFNTNYLTGDRVATVGAQGSCEDIFLDHEAGTVTLRRGMSIDLGAVAKGFAVDLAARELVDLPGFVINAGGDIYAGGVDQGSTPWEIGIRHPRRPNELLTCLRVSDAAVCTSGDYERVRAAGAGHHILHPSSGASAGSAASVTVVAPTAALADALSTAVFVLGPEAGLALLDDQGVDGLIVRPDLSLVETAGMARYRA